MLKPRGIERERPPAYPRLASHGSPGLQGCWADESANLDLKRIAQSAHVMHWHGRVLNSWGALSGKGIKRNLS